MFIVMEIQQTDDTTVSTIVNSYVDRNSAESKYHTILSAAAVSSVLKHSAIILTENATPLKYEFYTHYPESESQTEPE